MKFSGWSPFPIHKNQLNAELSPTGEGRPSGLHLSGIIHRMKVAAGEKVGGIKGDQEGVRMMEGFLWEIALEYMTSGLTFDEAMDLAFKRHMGAVRRQIATQIKLERDNVHMTPDGFDNAEGSLESYKYTRRSFKSAVNAEEFESNFWPWFIQEKSYCLAAGVDTVKWIVCFASGDYTRGPGGFPKVLEGSATFTPEELVSNWKIVMAHAASMTEEDYE